MSTIRSVKPTRLATRARRLCVEALETRAMLAGEGLVGQYFHNPDFTGLAAERTEPVDFNWGSGSPVAGVDPSTFSVRWTGQVEPLYSEPHTFITTSNQGVRLWVDGRLLIDNWTPHNTEEDSAVINLTAGQKYDIRLEYYEHFGGAEIRLEWSSPSLAREVLPASRLHESPSGLRGEYADAFGGGAVRVDPVIDFDWGIGRPHPSVAVDQVNVRWSGQIRADYSDEYVFSIESDEGARLWVGNELIIDDWEPHVAHEATGAKPMEAGKWYDVRLDYFDKTGAAEVRFSWSSDNQTGAGEFEVVPASNLRASKAAGVQFFNPLGPGQDPYVTRWNDGYLHVRSAGGSVMIDWAPSLEHIHSSSPLSTTTVAWTAPPGTNYSRQIWAPEIHQIGGKWYIYVAASDGDNVNHRMHVLERDDPDPLGQYVYRGKLATNPDRWAIDGTVLDWQGQLYFIWSGWPGATDGVQNLYIAEMSDPLTVSGPRVLLSSPEYAWERFGLPINEGPQVLIHEGKLHIIYSGSGYWRHEYALGRLTYDGVGPLLDPASWQKSPTPVFQQAGDVVGTGHASFTTSPDGAEHWIVYHAHHDADNFQDDRDIYIQPFEFTPSGAPDFGTPIPASTPLPVPSGEPDPERPFVSGDYDASGVVDGKDYLAWSQGYGQAVFPGSGADGNRNGLVDTADYTRWRDSLVYAQRDPTVAYWRHEEGTSGGLIPAGPDTVLDSSGAGNHMRTFDPAFTSATYSTSVSPLPLRSGLANTLSLNFGPGGDDPGLNDDNYSDGKEINSHGFDELTVELAFNMNSIGGFQALIGKDGAPVASPVPPLKIMVRGDDFPNGIDNQLFVEWIDGDGDIHYLAGGSPVTAGAWNHVAFVLEDSVAKLYVAGELGPYALVDSTSGQDFAGIGGHVLYDISRGFTVGRGAYDNQVTDWADALIDEARISDMALEEPEFLFAPNAGALAVNAGSWDPPPRSFPPMENPAGLFALSAMAATDPRQPVTASLRTIAAIDETLSQPMQWRSRLATLLLFEGPARTETQSPYEHGHEDASRLANWPEDPFTGDGYGEEALSPDAPNEHSVGAQNTGLRWT